MKTGSEEPQGIQALHAETMDPFLDLGLSLGLGLLIGLQRERTATQLGGIRTFPLISLFGTMCGLLGTRYGVWMPAAGLLAVLGILALSNFLAVQKGAAGPGQTSEIAALLTFTLGAYLPEGNTSVVL
ncbi:MAG TPA: MgtC/SapB family protein, partial [Clostridia bacterium]|nr:MgtC/SapB family protein [Clostridia bacterium]